MRLSIPSLVVAALIGWGGCVFLAGLAHMIWPQYGTAFLAVLDSVYPGYHATGSFGSTIVATLYAALDGALGAAVFGWLYNRFAGADREKAEA